MNGISKKFLLIVSTLLVVIAGALYLYFRNSTKDVSGRIILRRQQKESPYKFEMLLMDGSGNDLQEIGQFTGSPTWSPNGNMIAVGCPPNNSGIVDEVCILDISTLPNLHSFPQESMSSHPTIAAKIELPEQCKQYQYNVGSIYEGILSLSWAPDGKRIAIVCGDTYAEHTREVCILSQEEESYCWDNSIGGNIYRAVWSPTEDVLAISGPSTQTTKIYFVNPDGTNPIYVTDGSSPAWSPDGKRIAFIKFESLQPRSNMGIAVINIDGTHQKWLYLPEPSGFPNNFIDLDACWDISGTCRLSWSPDERYITFIGSIIQQYQYRLFRLDIKTGKIVILLDSDIFGNLVAEPDWGP